MGASARPRRYPPEHGGIGPGSQKHNPVVNAGEESNSGVVPAKLPNRVGGDTGRGGGGGKARDQGERQRVCHVPDPSGKPRVPEARWRAWARVTITLSRRQTPKGVASKVRTVCGSAASTGLCGGGRQRPSLPRRYSGVAHIHPAACFRAVMIRAGRYWE